MEKMENQVEFSEESQSGQKVIFKDIFKQLYFTSDLTRKDSLKP